MRRSLRLSLVVAGSLAAAPLAAQGAAERPSPPPVQSLRTNKPPPRDPAVDARLADPATRKLYAEHCGAGAVRLDDPRLDSTMRIGFAAEPGQPARLILCLDAVGAGLPNPIRNIDTALAVMAYKPFAPFWPAAEARWGSDMSVLREEIRQIPLGDALAAYPYADLMETRTAVAFAASRTAASAGDHERARRAIADELERLTAVTDERKGAAGVGFEVSLLIGRLANLAALRDGPSAGADLMAALLARHPFGAEYRPNTDTNHAAMLAEAGRSREALAIMRPLLDSFDFDGNAERYAIPGSMREFSWIMACALSREEGPEAAARYVRLVASFEPQPIDPYVGWTKSTGEIRLRMHKCLGDPKGFIAAMRDNPPAVISPIWLEFQEQGRPMVGLTRLAGLIDEARTQGFAGDYRQLPESYWPALRSWQPPRGPE